LANALQSRKAGTVTDDREALVSEIQRLLRVNRRWRAVAIVALGLVFLVMFPFMMTLKEVIRPLRQVETDRFIQDVNAAWAEQQKEIQELKKQLKGKGG
jgi:hypothetical protein